MVCLLCALQCESVDSGTASDEDCGSSAVLSPVVSPQRQQLPHGRHPQRTTG